MCDEQIVDLIGLFSQMGSLSQKKVSPQMEQKTHEKQEKQKKQKKHKKKEGDTPIVFQNLPIGISMSLISRVCSHTPENLSQYTNCCWANGVLFLLFACDVSLDDVETDILADAIRSQNSNVSGPVTLFHILKKKSLPLKLVQYCVEDGSEFTVGNEGTSGETLVMVLENGHFQLGAYPDRIIPASYGELAKSVFNHQIAFEYKEMMSRMVSDFMMAYKLSQENSWTSGKSLVSNDKPASEA